MHTFKPVYSFRRKAVVFFTLMASFFALSFLSSCSEATDIKAEDNSTIVYLVRHAEKLTGADVGHDPELSEAGQARAQTLIKALGDKGIQYIHSTDYIRTQKTAAPLASALGLDVLSYDPRDLPALAVVVKEMGGRHLIVGHSNTTPQATAALGGDAGSEIDEPNEYDRLYTVTILEDGTVTTKLASYGTPYAPAQ